MTEISRSPLVEVFDARTWSGLAVVRLATMDTREDLHRALAAADAVDAESDDRSHPNDGATAAWLELAETDGDRTFIELRAAVLKAREEGLGSDSDLEALTLGCLAGTMATEQEGDKRPPPASGQES